MSDEVTKLIVFGATGNTGIAILRTALEQGLKVSAFVRTPSKIPKDIKSAVNVIIGDVKDADAVAKAVEGHHAVLSSLGTGWSIANTTVMSEGCKNIVAGMRKCGIKRFAVVGTSFSFGNENAHWCPRFLFPVIKDHDRLIQFIKKQNDLDWFALMPPQIYNSKKVGKYEVSKGRTPGRNSTTTAELADFMVKCIIDTTSMKHFGHSLLGISSAPPILSSNISKAILAIVLLAVAFIIFYYGNYLYMI